MCQEEIASYEVEQCNEAKTSDLGCLTLKNKMFFGKMVVDIWKEERSVMDNHCF